MKPQFEKMRLLTCEAFEDSGQPPHLRCSIRLCWALFEQLRHRGLFRQTTNTDQIVGCDAQVDLFSLCVHVPGAIFSRRTSNNTYMITDISHVKQKGDLRSNGNSERIEHWCGFK